MRLNRKRQSQHRANADQRIVQTPSMARRPSTGDPAPTQVMPAVRDSHAEDFLTRELPKVSPADLPSAHPHTAFTPMSGHPAPPKPLDVTQVLPVVPEQKPAVDSTTTQVLPLVPSQVALPPSAKHADPAAWHARNHAEDEWSDVEVAQCRGRHVLDDLKSEPEVAVLVAAQQRAHVALDAYDPMRRAEAAARANDDRMRAFAASWRAWEDRFEREVESWATRFEKKLAATRAGWAKTSGQTNADRLALGMSGSNTVVAGMLESARMRVELDAMLAADEQVSA